jgi:hypothetical protein
LGGPIWGADSGPIPGPKSTDWTEALFNRDKKLFIINKLDG